MALPFYAITELLSKKILKNSDLRICIAQPETVPQQCIGAPSAAFQTARRQPALTPMRLHIHSNCDQFNLLKTPHTW
jgi:hypothetical protein